MTTVIKQGLTKLPIARVGGLARALALDPVQLLMLVMNEYQPGTLAIIEEEVDVQILTPNERAPATACSLRGL